MKKRQLLTMVLAGAMVMGTVGYGKALQNLCK